MSLGGMRVEGMNLRRMSLRRSPKSKASHLKTFLTAQMNRKNSLPLKLPPNARLGEALQLCVKPVFYLLQTVCSWPFRFTSEALVCLGLEWQNQRQWLKGPAPRTLMTMMTARAMTVISSE